MRKLATAIASIALIGTPAFAADMAVKMPVKAPPPSPVPVYDWTGFYIGANGGYGWKDPTVTFAPNDQGAFLATCGGADGSTCPPSASFGINGGLGGLQAGYNWQFSQQWLLGLETDFDWSGIRGTGTSNFLMFPIDNPPGISNFQASEDIRWFGTVRGRLGFLPATNVLVYATGGLAYGRVDENVSLNNVGERMVLSLGILNSTAWRQRGAPVPSALWAGHLGPLSVGRLVAVWNTCFGTTSA